MKILAESLLHQNFSLIFLAWETLGRPSLIFLVWETLGRPSVVHPLAYYMDISSLLQVRSYPDSKTNKREMPKSWLAGNC